LRSDPSFEQKGQLMSSYTLAYWTAAVLLLINVAIGAIQATYASGHGAELGITPQVQAWLAVSSTVVAAALAFLPQITRTPRARETSYLQAAHGMLPADLAAKYPPTSFVITHPGTTTTAGSATTVTRWPLV
jgi:hypothetical protein